ERVNDRISNNGDQGVEHRRRIEGKTRNHWSRYAAQPVLATSYLSPSEGDRVKHRRQCQREEGEIDSPPTENHVAKRHQGESNDSKTHADWEQDRAREKLELGKPGSIGRKSKPGAMTKGREPRVADQNVECRASNSKDDHLGRRGDAESDRRQCE